MSTRTLTASLLCSMMAIVSCNNSDSISYKDPRVCYVVLGNIIALAKADSTLNTSRGYKDVIRRRAFFEGLIERYAKEDISERSQKVDEAVKTKQVDQFEIAAHCTAEMDIGGYR